MIYNCRQTMRLVSEGLDRDLSWPARLGVRFHLWWCRDCRRFAAQLLRLHAWTRYWDAALEEHPPASWTLSPECRGRILEALRQDPQH